MTGKVYLVGAGPGDPGLITVKGLDLLRRADVIIYDRLIPLSLLDETRPEAERIDAGKQPQKHRLSQDDINALIVDRAQAGKMVVRLKGGDPFVFGRGGEEALVCHAAGIPFEIVPGVTSAIAVPAYAGMPVTQRGVTAAFTVFSGHENPNEAEGGIDYDAMAAAARVGTLVLLMGVNHLSQITEHLIAAGVEKATPAACIEQGTKPQQRVIVGTLETLPDLVAQAQFQPPAITVIGQVVSLRDAGLNWFR